LLFHIANSLLLFYLFYRMTNAPWKSAFVAALFALHPLHVESVAWVAERKDILSTFFLLLTIAAYIKYTKHKRFMNYLAVLLFFALGLMAKPMLVTLPFVLLLLDYWPLQRFELMRPNGQHPKEEEKATLFNQASIRSLLLEKAPFFALATLSSVVTFIAQKKGGAVAPAQIFSPGVRIANALVSYGIYIEKMIWPKNLALFYPHPGPRPVWQIAAAVTLIGAVTFLVILKARRFPYLIFGWLWFAITLVPVIGIVQVGGQAMADRYTYVPLIGLFVMAAWGLPDLTGKMRCGKQLLLAASLSSLAVLFILTRIQVGYWKDSITLYNHSLGITVSNFQIFTTRGTAYLKLGNYREAIEDFDKALDIEPKLAIALYNRGIAYERLGDRTKAISDFNRAIEISPNYSEAYNNRGLANAGLGNFRLAVADYDMAIKINPESTAALNNRGTVNCRLGENLKAISDFSRAIEIDPMCTEAYLNRGIAYHVSHSYKAAIEDFNSAIKLSPGLPQPYYARALTYVELGEFRRAVDDYSSVIGISPENPDAYIGRGKADGKLGNYRQAIEDFDRAIEINPVSVIAYFKRGVAYGRLGAMGKAIQDFDKVIELDPGYTEAYFNRGIAEHELGRQTSAIEDLKQAAKRESADAGRVLNSWGVNE
jgi:tetratricopeptide (TPR) repeat protein